MSGRMDWEHMFRKRWIERLDVLIYIEQHLLRHHLLQHLHLHLLLLLLLLPFSLGSEGKDLRNYIDS